MRHAAVTFAEEIHRVAPEGRRFALILCSDMLNLAEFRSLAPRWVRDVPAVVYFHENQLTYPVRAESERDYQFAMTNMTSALAAEAVWFNSAYHRDSFLAALETFLRRMPDHQPLGAVEKIRRKADVLPPGVAEPPRRADRLDGPLRILWAARWEHDKNPEDFFEALILLKQRGIDFRISVIGEQFRDGPEVFARAREIFADRIDRWGYQPSRAEYETALLNADVFVSTARHEFFGLSAVEATLAGAYPLLPARLSYPEILSLADDERIGAFFYDGSPMMLAQRLVELAGALGAQPSLYERAGICRDRLKRFVWTEKGPTLDSAPEAVMARRH
jgi:glycosyltransferase involved in cell wall biosynthesis